jgi:hypothetical protein
MKEIRTRLLIEKLKKSKEAIVDKQFRRKKTTCPNKMFDKDMRIMNKVALKLMLNYYHIS